MSMLVVASAAMVNVRRVHRHLTKLRDEERRERGIQKQVEGALHQAWAAFRASCQRCA